MPARMNEGEYQCVDFFYSRIVVAIIRHRERQQWPYKSILHNLHVISDIVLILCGLRTPVAS